MKKYNFDGYKLFLQKTDKIEDSHVLVKYKFINPEGKILFEGDSLGIPYGQEPEGKWAAMQCLGWLTMSPDDNDQELFNGYTLDQLQFARSIKCQDLNLMVDDYKNKRK
jgi:hypothetical protein